MSRANAERVALFVRDHPDCKVSDLVAHFGWDAAFTWDSVIDADRLGFITMQRIARGPWQFRVKDTST